MYIKERFVEYNELSPALVKPTKPYPEVKKVNKTLPIIVNKSPYLFFKIVYKITDTIADVFQISKQDFDNNTALAIKNKVSATLFVPPPDVRVLSQDKENCIFSCEVKYECSPPAYVTYDISPVSDEFLENINMGSDDFLKPAKPESCKKPNPYKQGKWANSKWFCIRCGALLSQISGESEIWGEIALDNMLENGTYWYLCPNKNCYHNDAPYILHHPTDWELAPTDAYSLSWIK